MLTLLSPAKSLDFESAWESPQTTQPALLDHAQPLVEQLKQKAPHELSQLMGISDKLASLNAARYQAWAPPFTPDNSKPAVLAFTGDVYTGLDATQLSTEALNFAQEHLRILSGLYGVLRPLDLIQAYRLEMGTKLANPRGKDLYAYWKNAVTSEINETLSSQANKTLVNLASQEYFKSVDTQQLNTRIITPVFKDWKNGQFKIISFYAKKARGLMAQFICEQKIDHPDPLKDFDKEGYEFHSAMSEGDTWVFTRKEAN